MNVIHYAPETLLLPVILHYSNFSKKVIFTITLLLVFFFRNPNKNTNYSKSLLYAPSYGTIENIELTSVNGSPHIRISTFLSIFDPHFAYSPCKGKVINTVYTPGTFHPAYLGKKTEMNERLTTEILCENGYSIQVVQIAGIVARRIVSLTKPGIQVQPGQDIGLIKFGSRVDLLVPKDKIKEILVKKGEKVFGTRTKFVGLY